MGLDQMESKKAVQDTLIAAINLYFDSALSDDEVIDLIPVKPIGEHESEISAIYQSKLMGLFQKIKP